MLLFAFSILINNKGLFFIVSCIARFLQGASVSALSNFKLSNLNLYLKRYLILFLNINEL